MSRRARLLPLPEGRETSKPERAGLREALQPLLGEEGQAVTESSIILSGMLLLVFVGLPSVMHWAPEMLEALTIYMRGFYVVLGFPLG